MVCACSFLHIREWSSSAPVIIMLLVCKSAFLCFMEHTELSTAACMPWRCGCKFEAIEHSEFPQCFWVAEHLMLNACVLFHWENAVFNSSPSFSFYTYGEEAQWLPVEFHCEVPTDGLVQGSLKGTQGKKLCFCLFFLFISSLLKCIFCITSQKWYCSNFNVGRIHENYQFFWRNRHESCPMPVTRAVYMQ